VVESLEDKPQLEERPMPADALHTLIHLSLVSFLMLKRMVSMVLLMSLVSFLLSEDKMMCTWYDLELDAGAEGCGTKWGVVKKRHWVICRHVGGEYPLIEESSWEW
jgi:hypothetical protein